MAVLPSNFSGAVGETLRVDHGAAMITGADLDPLVVNR
jgi:hypothetical protein